MKPSVVQSRTLNQLDKIELMLRALLEKENIELESLGIPSAEPIAPTKTFVSAPAPAEPPVPPAAEPSAPPEGEKKALGRTAKQNKKQSPEE